MDAPGATPALEPLVAISHRGEELLIGPGAPRAQLLMFVPFAFTPVCAAELDAFAALAPEAELLGVELLVVSCDSAAVLAAWLAQHEADRLAWLHGVSDFWPHGRLARRFDAFDETTGAALRHSFAVRPDGRVRLLVQSASGQARPFREHRRGLSLLADGA